MEEEAKTLKDYLNMLRRRKYLIALPAITLMIASAVVAVMLPPVYQSDATILIEQQQIPTDLVKSTVTSYADERIKLIEQRLMTVTNLSKVIEKYGMYQKQRGKNSATDLVDLFRENTVVQLINADVASKGRSAKATIAFKLIFSDREPETAQRVANELVTLFLNENVRTRTESAEQTTKFLEEESEKFKVEIQKIENAIADYKQTYGASLPELLPANMQMIGRLETELQQLTMTEKLLGERRISLGAQLAITSPSAVSQNTGSSAPVANSLVELKALESSLLSKYSDSHPDVQRVRRQIENMEGSGDKLNEATNAALTQAKQDLTELKDKYTDTHPEVKAKQKQVADLEKQLAAGHSDNKPSQKELANQGITNPAYLQLKSELEIAEVELQNIKVERASMQQKLQALENNVSQTHQVERGYYDLMRDLDNNKNKYQELKAKQLEAKLGQTMEEEQKAEAFTLIEPPIVPQKPIKPNRLKVLTMGFGFSIGFGIGIAFLAEMIDGSIRGHRALAAVAGFEPIIVIPYIKDEADFDKTRRHIRIFIIATLILILVLIIAVHFLYMPLDLLFYKIWARLALM